MGDDARLKKMFTALKQEDMRRAPDVDTILQRAAAAGRPPGRRLPIYRIAAVLALLAIGFGGFYHYYRHNIGLSAFSSTSMAQWQSPTEALLAFPGRPLSDGLDGGGQWGPSWETPLNGTDIPQTYFLDMPAFTSIRQSCSRIL